MHIIFISGFVFGSFLALVCERIPQKISIVKPRSHCDHCKQTLHPLDLIPLMSFLCLNGRCRHCGVKIGWFSLFIELSTAISWCFIYHTKGFTYQGFVSLCLHSLLLCVSVIDARHQIILYRSHALFILLSLMTFNALSLGTRLIGALSLSTLFFIVAILTQGLGGGDVLLIASTGFLLGYPAIIYVGIIANFSALLYALIRRIKEPFAFGPFICLGVFIVYHFGHPNLDLSQISFLFSFLHHHY